MTDQTKVAFSSEVNYLKRDPDLVGTSELTLPGAFSTVSKTVNHALGYVPFVHVGVEINNDGKIWANSIVNQYTETSLSGVNPPNPTMRYYVTTSDLVISLTNDSSPTASGVRSVYWAIYLDYGDG